MNTSSYPKRNKVFDWLLVIFSWWFLGGLYVDGWAHNHDVVDNSFFTPWHAMFYSGFTAVALLIVITWWKNYKKGYTWSHALPEGYTLSLLGIVMFTAGGFGDMLWHIAFGIEKNIEALLSPTHLVLAVGGTLLAAGGLMSFWKDKKTQKTSFIDQLPLLTTLLFILSIITFLTEFAHPFHRPFAAPILRTANPAHGEVIGVVSILLQTAILMGVILFALRRWKFAFGSFTFLFTANAALMSVLPMPSQYWVIPVAFFAGFITDVVYKQLLPSPRRVVQLRLFSFFVPCVLYALYFATLIATQGVWWAIHLWTGVIIQAGIVGLLLCILMFPPEVPEETA